MTDKELHEQIEVTLVEEHEDGSATYNFKMSAEVQARIFQAFMLEGIIRGVTQTEEMNALYLERKRRFGEGAVDPHDPADKDLGSNH